MKFSLLKTKICLFLLVIFVNQAFSFGSEKSIKVAILDNFHFQPYITNDFGENFLNGVKLAKSLMSKKGYTLEYKIFDYDRENPLDIFASIKKLKAWNPDVIIAPRNSNMFLITKDSFEDILVISPFATSDLVSRMPENYYSLAFPDKYMASTINKYLEEEFPKKTVYALIESNCKNCMDLGKDFSEVYNKNHPDSRLLINTFVQDDVEIAEVKQLLKGYRDGQLIFLPDTAYSSAVLMARITNYLGKQTVFIGGDDWGSWENTEVGKLHANFPYYGLRFTPASLDIDSQNIAQFKLLYRNFYHCDPKGDAALLGFNTIISIVMALERYAADFSSEAISFQILKSYQAALKENPNWFRLEKYAVYKVQPEKEEYIGSVDVPFNGALASHENGLV